MLGIKPEWEVNVIISGELLWGSYEMNVTIAM
jgi:hypothetical protein